MVRGASRRSGSSFGSNTSANRKSRGERLRDRYSTDRYPTAEDFIRAVEQNPEHFDPGSMDQGKFRYDDSGNGRGVGYSDLKGSNKSNWIEDNPIDVDIDADPGSISMSKELWNNEEGDSVSVVAGLDLVPMGIDINVNGDVGTVAVDLGMPGDAIGVTVGASFDTESGEVIGGQIGLAGAGLSVNVNQIKKDGETCTTITVTYFGVGTSYQRCRKDDDDDKKDPKKDPPPPNDDESIPIPAPPFIPGNPDDIVSVFTGGGTIELTIFKSVTTHTRFYSKATTIGGTDWETAYTSIDIEVLQQDFINNKKYTFNKIINGSFTIDISKRYMIGITGSPAMPAIESGENFTNTDFNNLSSPSGILYGTIRDINNSFASTGVQVREIINTYPDSLYKNQWVQYQTVLSVYNHTKNQIETPDPPDPPDPPIPPEDTMKCCDLEPVMSMLRKLNQALAVDEVVDQGLKLPNEWILPTGKGHSHLKNYLEIAVFLAKMQDHLGVHPMTVQIADLNAGQEGNQNFKKFYPNGTKAIQEILTILHDENSDSADRLNLQMRLAILNTRIFVTVASIARSLRGIFQFLGTPLKEKRDVVPLPFDYTYGLRKNKGFSQNAAQDAKQLEEAMGKIEAELNKNTESATEALLAKFLNDSDQPIIFETFDNAHPDLLTLLRAVNTQLKNK